MNHYFVVEIIGGVEPVLHGPYFTMEGRDKKARMLSGDDPERKNGLYKIVVKDNMPVISAYSRGFFDER